MLRSIWAAAIIGIMMSFVLGSAAHGADYVTGAKFNERLHVPVGLNWAKNPIASGLGNLSRAQSVAIVLDRRVPPASLVDFQSEPNPFWGILDGLCARRSLNWSTVGDVVYIGPSDAASRLDSLVHLHRRQLSSLPASRRSALNKAAVLRWPHLARPRQEFAKLCQDAGLKVENLDALPHDLWAANELPQMTWVERATLLLNQFDLTMRFSADGRALKLMPIPQAEFERLHVLPSSVRESLRELPPQIAGSLKRDRSGIRVTGSYAAHDFVAKWILRRRKGTPRSAAVGEKVYELRIDNQPVGGVIKGLAAKLGWTPQVSPEASKLLGQRVSFQVKGATAEQVIAAAVKPAGLAHRLRGKVLEIVTPEEL